MPIITSDKLQESYDVVIVGSGAGGGQTAYALTMEGVKVLMLEAGRSFDPAAEVAMFQLPSHAPLRGVSTPDKQYGFHDCSIHSGWDIPGEPYTNAKPEPENQFRWWRQRMMGGRTNHWGRITLRNGPYDFKPRTRFGAGFDWPIGYEDIAPAGCRSVASEAASGQCKGAEDPEGEHAHALAVLLGYGLSPRLFDRCELRFANRASSARARDGESRHPAQRDGA
jgi:choline dehydrogenase-like flavoprotein